MKPFSDGTEKIVGVGDGIRVAVDEGNGVVVGKGVAIGKGVTVATGATKVGVGGIKGETGGRGVGKGDDPLETIGKFAVLPNGEATGVGGTGSWEPTTGVAVLVSPAETCGKRTRSGVCVPVG